MSCEHPKPLYLSHAKEGISGAVPVGDGYTVEIQWTQAFPDVNPFQIIYNIYYSTLLKDVFSEGVKHVSVAPGILLASIYELTPGDTYYFAVRATEYNPSWYDPNLLPDGFPDLKVYPETILTAAITEESIDIPITDINEFPPRGIIQIGYELIRYSNKDVLNNTLIATERGFLSTNIRFHQPDGYDGYVVQDPIVRFWKGFEEENATIYQATSKFAYPHFPRTFADGYRETLKDSINTDLSADEALQTNFQPYDYVGWHRTDPEQLFDGACIGTYYGGELFCADGYGVGFQVRGIPFNEANNQRQEMLLDLEGDPCCLLRRKTTGITCSCYESATQNPSLRCPNCFIPGTLVKTKHGYTPIEKIKVGDKVLSSDGYYHDVIKVFEEEYSGTINKIESTTTTNPIYVTSEHPFLVLGGGHRNNISRKCGPKCDDFIKRGDGDVEALDIRQLTSGRWHTRISTLDRGRITLGTYDTREEAINVINNFKKDKFYPGHILEWNRSENLVKGDWLTVKWNQEVNDLELIQIPQQFCKNTKLGIERLGPTSFKVDADFLWMIGLYLAEGSSNNREIVFALHKDETQYQKRLINYFNKLGYNSKIRQTSQNGIAICICSTNLSRWFSTWLGKKCYNKVIPEELISLSDDKTKALIQGIYDGDGSKKTNEIGQTSEILALQLIELLHRIGKQPLVRKQISNFLTPKGNKRRVCYIVSWENDTLLHENRKGRWKFIDKEQGYVLLSQIKSTTQEHYSGKIYNLEIEDNPTYVINGGIVVHNCFGTGFVTGYDQYHFPRRSDGRIMVKFDPTEEDIKIEDEGLEGAFLPNCWTLTVPALKSRDVLIRFNVDGTEEFRYKILRVTRNRLLSSISGAQKFSAVRVRRTDPIYQWRAIRNTAMYPERITTGIGMVSGPGGIPPHTHELVINEHIVTLGQINQTTSWVRGHNHEVRSGIIQSSLSHVHPLILP